MPVIFSNTIQIYFFRANGYREWYHYRTPEKGFGSFLGEMPGAVYNVSVDSHALTDIYLCCIIAHRSPPVDQPNSALTVGTAVGTKRARMMPGSKIVLPSSDVEDYSGLDLRNSISCIANPKGMIQFSYRLLSFL